MALVGYPTIARQHTDRIINSTIILETPDTIALGGTVIAFHAYLYSRTKWMAFQVWRPSRFPGQFMLVHTVVS